MRGDIAMVETVEARDLRAGDTLWTEFGYHTVRKAEMHGGGMIEVTVDMAAAPLRFRAREHVLTVHGFIARRNCNLPTR